MPRAYPFSNPNPMPEPTERNLTIGIQSPAPDIHAEFMPKI